MNGVISGKRAGMREQVFNRLTFSNAGGNEISLSLISGQEIVTCMSRTRKAGTEKIAHGSLQKQTKALFSYTRNSKSRVCTLVYQIHWQESVVRKHRDWIIDYQEKRENRSHNPTHWKKREEQYTGTQYA